MPGGMVDGRSVAGMQRTGSPTDSEFSWRHPYVRKAVFTKPTNHGV